MDNLYTINSSHSLKLPNFCVPEKANARRVIIDEYCAVSGENSVKGTYWTLCCKQDKSDSLAEINQMVALGFLKEEQFVGIDYDEQVIAQNRTDHPNAIWYAGDWISVIRKEQKLYETADLIYYDSIHTVSNPAGLKRIAFTLNRARKERVMVAVNVMFTSGRSNYQFDREYILENLGEHLFGCWTTYNKHHVYQTTRSTIMGTFIFHRGFK